MKQLYQRGSTATTADRLDRTLREAITLNPDFNPDVALVTDSGISVVAHWSGAVAGQATAAFYLGLGDDQAGRAFSSTLSEAVASAKAR